MHDLPLHIEWSGKSKKGHFPPEMMISHYIQSVAANQTGITLKTTTSVALRRKKQCAALRLGTENENWHPIRNGAAGVDGLEGSHAIRIRFRADAPGLDPSHQQPTSRCSGRNEDSGPQEHV